MTHLSSPAQASTKAPQHLHSTTTVHLGEVIEVAAHLLPAQGPITVFIHHNTLHAFEDLPFTEAIKKGAKVFGCQPFLTKDRYREELSRGRIRFADLHAVLQSDLGPRREEKVIQLASRLELRMAMLQFPLRSGPTEELRWFVAETDALRHIRGDVCEAVRKRLIAETRRWVMRDLRGGNEAARNDRGPAARSAHPPSPALAGLIEQFGESAIEDWSEETWEAFALRALWRICSEGVASTPPAPALPLTAVRHRDLLLEATGADTDALVNDLLIRFCAAFLDQGFADWELPQRDEGFFRSFCALYRQPLGPPDRWMRGLAQELARIADAGVEPLESIRESLEILGIGDDEWEAFLVRDVPRPARLGRHGAPG